MGAGGSESAGLGKGGCGNHPWAVGGGGPVAVAGTGGDVQAGAGCGGGSFRAGFGPVRPGSMRRDGAIRDEPAAQIRAVGWAKWFLVGRATKMTGWRFLCSLARHGVTGQRLHVSRMAVQYIRIRHLQGCAQFVARARHGQVRESTARNEACHAGFGSPGYCQRGVPMLQTHHKVINPINTGTKTPQGRFKFAPDKKGVNRVTRLF